MAYHVFQLSFSHVWQIFMDQNFEEVKKFLFVNETVTIEIESTIQELKLSLLLFHRIFLLEETESFYELMEVNNLVFLIPGILRDQVFIRHYHWLDNAIGHSVLTDVWNAVEDILDRYVTLVIDV